MNRSPLRYFSVIALHPGHNLVILAAVTLLGVWTIAMSPGELDSALGMLLFVQMFLASTGFLPRARRGHFDPLLTSTPDRREIVIAHWLASAGPGLLAWLLLSTLAWTLGSRAALSAFAGERMLAMGVVSAVAWAAGFALGRGAAGALWAAGLLAALLRRTDLMGAAPVATAVLSPLTVLRHAAVVVACPFLLLTARSPFAPESITAGGCTAALVLLVVWQRSDRVDCYLRDRT
jgi:hypothetical protein